MLFNAALAERLRDGLLSTVLAGDVMQVTASGGKFVAEVVAIEQPRLDVGEIAVTGPIFRGSNRMSYRESRATGVPLSSLR